MATSPELMVANVVATRPLLSPFLPQIILDLGVRPKGDSREKSLAHSDENPQLTDVPKNRYLALAETSIRPRSKPEARPRRNLSSPTVQPPAPSPNPQLKLSAHPGLLTARFPPRLSLGTHSSLSELTPIPSDSPSVPETRCSPFHRENPMPRTPSARPILSLGDSRALQLRPRVPWGRGRRSKVRVGLRPEAQPAISSPTGPSSGPIQQWQPSFAGPIAAQLSPIQSGSQPFGPLSPIIPQQPNFTAKFLVF
ncbi:hypothetical protein CRG98_000608 [Punica granatum]|uniref:Uncharacterized protein n=1 Tax=Punica granatum TaxID=22663 RepID=A0A2I0LE66_PUNGR|nr:hypothetical protein CRG98_000608 [Punica granatum]